MHPATARAAEDVAAAFGIEFDEAWQALLAAYHGGSEPPEPPDDFPVLDLDDRPEVPSAWVAVALGATMIAAAMGVAYWLGRRR
ncbi:MAG: hypothetical protein ACPGNP_12640 [Acidimicrobiales bacterium]